MNNTALVWLVVIVIVIVGGAWYYFSYLGNPLPTAPQTNETNIPAQGNTNTGSTAGGGTDTTVNVDISVSNAPMSASIIYSASGFSPAEVTIKKGGTVTWSDQGTGRMWVASAQHPTHSGYSGTTLAQHCDTLSNDSFDQCEEGGSYSFTFDKVGTWAYHNHSQSSHFGRIIVVE